MSKLYPAMAEILPHADPMILLDKVIVWQPDKICCEVKIHPQSHLFDDEVQAVPAYASIEYMAQTVAALAGLEAMQAQRSVEVGFLLGTRKCHYRQDHFPLGSCLHIHAERLYAEDEGLAVFACEVIDEQGVSLMKAQLNVFQPKNAQQFVKGESNE